MILIVYRYISLITTSLFYLLTYSEHELIKKITIILCLSISSIILSHLYPIFKKSPRNIITLLSIETIGNIILLIPSGGMKSPFIWYSLNTILISAVFLKRKFYWAHFTVYYIGYLLFDRFINKREMDIIQIIIEESNLILSFIMITIAIHVFVMIIKKIEEDSKELEKINIQLESANNIIIESMNHNRELYQSINILTNQGNKEGILGIAFEHIQRITKADTVFFYDVVDECSRLTDNAKGPNMEMIEKTLKKDLKYISGQKNPLEIYIEDFKFLIIPINSIYTNYGILGLGVNNGEYNKLYEDYIGQLQFLSELISSAFERLDTEGINQRLIITEEQNRIANEIHDSVLQRLFSMSCGIFSLIKGLGNRTDEEILQELNLFRDNTDKIMKELREKIYGLSWKKLGNSSFNSEVNKYIEDIKRMSNVNIPFIIVGNIEHTTNAQKKALYRMICEGVGNAIHHGKAKEIEIKLQISTSTIDLTIKDDGQGFELQSKEITTGGLGLKNLKQLAEGLQGSIKIKSELNKGTRLEIVLPNTLDSGGNYEYIK